uniref:Uncharacterized protein n=1 Tax=Romanomermis culicivorax TaxID=13658 RepID=A0A915JHX7_ROMCU
MTTPARVIEAAKIVKKSPPKNSFRINDILNKTDDDNFEKRQKSPSIKGYNDNISSAFTNVTSSNNDQNFTVHAAENFAGFHQNPFFNNQHNHQNAYSAFSNNVYWYPWLTSLYQFDHKPGGSWAIGDNKMLYPNSKVKNHRIFVVDNRSQSATALLNWALEETDFKLYDALEPSSCAPHILKLLILSEKYCKR